MVPETCHIDGVDLQPDPRAECPLCAEQFGEDGGAVHVVGSKPTSNVSFIFNSYEIQLPFCVSSRSRLNSNRHSSTARW